MNGEEKKLKAHLMRRAGFGATANELDQLDNLTYDELVESLLHPIDTSWMGEHLVDGFTMSSRG